jgi:hypothetical protein
MVYTGSITQTRLLKEFIKPILITVFLLIITLSGTTDESLAQSSETPPNVYSPLITDTYPNLTVTSSSGIGGNHFSNLDNLIDSNLDNSATWQSVVGLTGAWIQVLDQNATGGQAHPSGSYAGFVISDTGIDLLGDVTVSTFLGGTEQESVSGGSLLALSLSGDRAKAGFVTSMPFDRIRVTFSGVTLLTTVNVFYAEILSPGDAAELVCNVSTAFVQDDFAVIIEPERTGPAGLATVGAVSNTENVISDDLDAFGTIELLASIGGSGSISVRDIGQSYEGGHYAGFELSNASLLTGDLELSDLLNSITVETYLEGTLQEAQDGAGDNLILSVSLLDATDRYTAGFITTEDFDEVRITLDQDALIGLDLGVTHVYHATITQFCEQAFECGGNILNSPDYPVVVNSQLSGLACVNCSVENESNLISENTNDFATIDILTDVLGEVSVSVKDVLQTYPAGTTAGFVVEHINPALLDADLLENLEVCTYLGGEEQECVSGATLLRLTLLLPLIGSLPDGLHSVGFETTMEYDEIQFSVGSLAGVDRKINVYNAFVEAYDEDGGGAPCPPVEITLNGNPCYRMLSSPVTALNYQQILSGIWTQGMPGANYPGGDANIFLWPVDEPDDAQDGWVTLPDMNNEVPAGTGFLVSVFEDDEYGVPDPQPWPKTIRIPFSPQPGSFILDGDDMNQHPGGWTLLGNPFQFNMDVTQIPTSDLTGAFYVYDNNAGGSTNGIPGGWVSNADGFGDLEGNAIAVGQGFFVQTDGNDPSITFSEESRTESGTFYGKEREHRNYVRLELQGEGFYNSAWIRFSEQGSFSTTYGDALQLYPYTQQYAVLATQKEEGELTDIGHFPIASGDDKLEIPLYTDVTAAGTYILTATDLDLPVTTTLFLKDLYTGETVQIDNQFEYSFTVSQAGRQVSPDQGLVCSDTPTQAKTTAAQPRFIITNESFPGENELPEKIVLNQNYPNPFNPTTVISYELPQSSEVSLQVFDISGRLITTLNEGYAEAGTHTATFDAGNLSSGVYIYTLQAGDVVLNRKLTLIK